MQVSTNRWIAEPKNPDFEPFSDLVLENIKMDKIQKVEMIDLTIYGPNMAKSKSKNFNILLNLVVENRHTRYHLDIISAINIGDIFSDLTGQALFNKTVFNHGWTV